MGRGGGYPRGYFREELLKDDSAVASGLETLKEK